MFDRLKLAYLYNDSELKEATLNYIMKKSNAFNYKVLLNSPQWFEFCGKNPKLAGEISNAILNKIDG